MKQITYNKVSGVLFAVMGVVHAVRVSLGWDVTIYNFALPIWASVVAVIVLLFLAYSSMKLRR